MKTTKMLNDKVIKSIVLGLSASMVLTPVTSIVTSVEALADEGEAKEEKTEEKKEASEDKDSSEDNYKVDKEESKEDSKEESKDSSSEEKAEESHAEESKSEESAPAPAAEESAPAPAAEESAPAAEESAPAAEKKESSSKAEDAEESENEATADYSSVDVETTVQESFKILALSADGNNDVKYVDVDIDTLSLTEDELAGLTYDENGVAEWYDAQNDKTYIITKTETTVVTEKDKTVDDAELLKQIAAAAAATGSNTVTINGKVYTYKPGTADTEEDADFEEVGIDPTDADLVYDENGKATKVVDGVTYIITRVVDTTPTQVTDADLLAQIAAIAAATGSNTVVIGSTTYNYVPGTPTTYPSAEIADLSVDAGSLTYDGNNQTTWIDTDGTKYIITKSVVKKNDTVAVTDADTLAKIREAAELVDADANGNKVVRVDGITYTYKAAVAAWTEDLGEVDVDSINGLDKTTLDEGTNTYTDEESGINYTIVKTTTSVDNDSTTDVTDDALLEAIKNAAEGIEPNSDGTITVTYGGVTYTYTPSVPVELDDYATVDEVAIDPADLTYDENNEATWTDPTSGITYTFTKTVTQNPPVEVTVTNADELATVRRAAANVEFNEDGVTKTVTIGDKTYTYTPSVDEATEDYLTYSDDEFAASLTYDENNEATATINGVTYTFKKTTTTSTDYNISVTEADTLAAIRAAAAGKTPVDGVVTVEVGGVTYRYTPSVDEATTDYLSFTDDEFAASLTYDENNEATATIDGVTYTFKKTTTTSTEYNIPVTEADTLAAIRAAAAGKTPVDGVVTVEVGGVTYRYTPSVDEATEDYKTITDAKVDPSSLTYDENGVATWTDNDGVTYTFKKTTTTSTQKDLTADADLLAKIRAAAESVTTVNSDGTKDVVIDGVTYKYTPKKTVESKASLELSQINVDPASLKYDENGVATWTDSETGVTYTFKKTTDTKVDKNVSVDPNSDLMNKIREAAKNVQAVGGVKTVVVDGITYKYTPGKEETKVSEIGQWLESLSGYDVITTGDLHQENHINGGVIVCGTLHGYNIIDNGRGNQDADPNVGTVSKINKVDKNCWVGVRVANQNQDKVNGLNGGQVNVKDYVSNSNTTNKTSGRYLEDLTNDAAEAIKKDIIDNYNKIVKKFTDNNVTEFIEDGIKYVYVSGNKPVTLDDNWNNIKTNTYDSQGKLIEKLSTVYVVAEKIKSVTLKSMMSAVIAPLSDIKVESDQTAGVIVGRNVTVRNETHTGYLQVKPVKTTTPDSAVYDKVTNTDSYKAEKATEQSDDSAKYDKTTSEDKYEATGSTKKTQDSAEYDETTSEDEYEAIGSTTKTQDSAEYDETTVTVDFEAIGSTKKTDDSAKYDLVTEDVDYESTSAFEMSKHSAVYTGKHDEVSYSATASREHAADPESATTDEEWDYSAVKEVEGENDSAAYFASEYSGVKVIKGEEDSAKYDLTETTVSYAAKTPEEEEETNPPEEPKEPETPESPEKPGTPKKKEEKKTPKKKTSEHEDTTSPYDTPSVSVLGELAAPEAGVLGELAAPESGVLGELEAPETGDDGYLAVFGEVAAALAMVGVGISLTKKKEEE